MFMHMDPLTALRAGMVRDDGEGTYSMSNSSSVAAVRRRASVTGFCTGRRQAWNLLFALRLLASTVDVIYGELSPTEMTIE
jgi:hypothetical protein